MSTVTKEVSLRLRSPRSPHPAEDQAGGATIRADLTLHGKEDIRERIACALSASKSKVRLDRYTYSASKLTARCSGEWMGRRIFAKILLANPYPIPARFKAPWEAPHSRALPVRGIGEQIETEWNMTLQMRVLAGGHSVPEPLGRSLSARTLVWEEAGGISLARMLKRTRWKSSMAKAGARALFQAGTWLRSVHEASHRRTDAVIDVPNLIRIANGFARHQQKEAWRYDRIASRILEDFLLEMGGATTFTVPAAVTHGDFCLSNLLWDDAGWRLAVLDFELASFRPICHDLFALVADLRSKLLNPLIPKSAVLSWERAFWRGYGPTSDQVASFVKSLALARVFYHHLARLLTRGRRKGRIGGINASLYRTFLERTVISQRLDLPAAFESSARCK